MARYDDERDDEAMRGGWSSARRGWDDDDERRMRGRPIDSGGRAARGSPTRAKTRGCRSA
jgi:hypothetical protein